MNIVSEEIYDALILNANSIWSPRSWIHVYFYSPQYKKFISNYSMQDHGKVHFIDGELLNIVGVDDVQIKIDNRTIRKLRNLRHILGLMKNMILIGQIGEEGYFLTLWIKVTMVIACGRNDRIVQT